MTVQDEVTQQGIVLTQAAATKVGALLAQEGRDDLRLRVAVQVRGLTAMPALRSTSRTERATEPMPSSARR